MQARRTQTMEMSNLATTGPGHTGGSSSPFLSEVSNIEFFDLLTMLIATNRLLIYKTAYGIITRMFQKYRYYALSC